jgi:hypothetical protein
MNAFQKAFLIISLVALPLILLFMKGMAYPHVELVGVAGLLLMRGVLHALGKVDPAPHYD